MSYCDEPTCYSQNILCATGKCLECFLKAIQDPVINREWMIDFLWNLKKEYELTPVFKNSKRVPCDDWTMARTQIEKERISCEFCADTANMIATKLGFEELTSWSSNMYHKTGTLSDMINTHNVFRMNLGLGPLFSFHCMVVVHGFVIHSNYQTHPLIVERITPEMIERADRRDFTDFGCDSDCGDMYFMVPAN